MNTQSSNGKAAKVSEIESSVDQSSSDRERFEQPRELPEELAKNVMVLTCESSAEGGSCVVHVIGTSHVSKESCRQVKEVISYLKPEVVFLELCNEREFMLEDKEKLNLQVPTLKEILHSMMKEHPLDVVVSLYLVKIANHLGAVLGAEFQVAFDEAKKYGGKIVLGDRPAEITNRRIWEPMPLWQKMKLLRLLYIETLFLPSADKLNTMLNEMDTSGLSPQITKCFPTLTEAFIHERDQYMSSRLLTYASESSSVVAVVGKAHLRGIKKYWQQSIDLEKLMEIPSSKARITNKRIISTLAAGIAVAAGIALGAMVRRHSLIKE